MPTWSAAAERAVTPQIRQAADFAGIPRWIAFGLVAQESGFNPRAYRAEPRLNDGSRGLTQILYGTAQGLGFSGAPDDLYNVELNLQLGFEYLRQMKERYISWENALSAYNGGFIGYQIRNPEYVNGVMAKAQYFADRWAAESSGLDPVYVDAPATDPLIFAIVAGGIGFVVYMMTRRG